MLCAISKLRFVIIN